MENKIDIFEIDIDALTAKDTLKRIVQFMESETVNTVEIVTLELLVHGQDDPEWREMMRQMDLVLPGEKEILEASEKAAVPLGGGAGSNGRLIKEMEKRVFLKMFLKYLQRTGKKVFLLAGQEADLLLLQEKLRPYAKGFLPAGHALLPQEGGRKDSVINEINGAEPDCIISVLPYPEQERFITEAKALLNARLWIGCSLILLQEENIKKPSGKLRKFFLKRTLRHLVDQQKSRQEE